MMFVVRNNSVLKNCLQHIGSLPGNKVWDVKIEEHKSTRSQQQNKLYWSWIKIIGDHVGQDKDDMHATFSIRLLGPELFVVDGKQYVRAKSTTKLTTKEFTEYLDAINATAMTLGLALPAPSHFGMEI